VGTSQERQIAARFRATRLQLESLLDRARDEDSWLQPGLLSLVARKRVLAPLFVELRALSEAGELSMSVERLIESYLHIIANRLLKGAARAQETVIYSFLVRLYEGQLARARNASR